jgi:hypothetical protein
MSPTFHMIRRFQEFEELRGPPMQHDLLRLSVFTSIFFVASICLAQQQTATLDGTVTDSSGAAVPGATVVVVDNSRGLRSKVQSNEAGTYTIPLLPPGDNYVVTITRQGFRSATFNNVSLQVAQTAKLDVSLLIGEVTDTVNVSSASPLLDTQTSSLGQVITGTTVQELPLNGRSSFRLIALTPGVTFSQGAYGQFGDVPVNTNQDSNFAINGGRSQSNEILIDGVPTGAGFFNSITTLPSVDDTQEFKVESNNLSAAYGRYAGGVVNVSTKNGTNALHGNVFEFLRNSWFDANDWFNKRSGNKIPPFRMNQFGGTLGGPLTVPKLYNGKERTFFFLSSQGTRRTKGSTTILTVPTAAQRRGDFSQTGIPQLYNPFSTNPTTKARTAFSGNQIPASLLDPVALKIQEYYPLPNTNGLSLTNNFISNAPVVLSQDFGSVRIDQNVTQKYHLFGRYAYSRTPLTQPNAFGNIADRTGAVGTTTFKTQSFAFDNTYAFTPSLLFTFNYGFARWYQIRKTLSYGFDNATLGFPQSLVNQISIPMFPSVTIASYTGLANQSYYNNGNDSHALIASLTKVTGRHTLIFGADGRLHRINYFVVNNSGGAYNFTQQFTRGPIGTATAGGNAYASFLMGVGSQGSIPIGSGDALQDLYGGIYVQDTFRITPRLTLNMGVRYDGETPYVDRHNRLNYFDLNIPSPARNPSFPNLAGGLVFASSSTNTSRAIYTRQHNNAAPRLGFAYSFNSTTVIRGGYGFSYASLELSNAAIGFIPNLGFSSLTNWNVSNDGGLTPADRLRNPFPNGLVQPTDSSAGASTQLGQAINVWYHNPPTPYTQQWNLDVQQQFPGNTLLDIGYAASHGVHLTSVFERNQLDPKYLTLGTALSTQVTNPFQSFVSIGSLAGPTVSRQQLLLPFPQFISVTEINNPYGSSSYNALQTKLVKRASHGVTLLAAYTWSKLISNVNGQLAPLGPTNNTTTQNYYDLPAERSISELDQAHNFVMNAVVELPFGKGHAYFSQLPSGAELLISGWKLSGIWVEQSGFPLTLNTTVTGGANRVNPVPNVNPVINGSRSNSDRVQAWFNTNAFVNPPAYTYGTLKRAISSVRSPGVQNLDATLSKDTAIFDRVHTTLRFDIFNVTNTPHFAAPDTGRNSATFGQINSTLTSPPSREMQVALKIAF